MIRRLIGRLLYGSEAVTKATPATVDAVQTTVVQSPIATPRVTRSTPVGLIKRRTVVDRGAKKKIIVKSQSSPSPPRPPLSQAPLPMVTLASPTLSRADLATQTHLLRLVDAMFFPSSGRSSTQLVIQSIPLLRNADRLTLFRLVCGNVLLHGGGSLLFCLRAHMRNDEHGLSTEELCLLSNAVAQRWVVDADNTRVHAELLLPLLIGAREPIVAVKAYEWLALLSYTFQSSSIAVRAIRTFLKAFLKGPSVIGDDGVAAFDKVLEALPRCPGLNVNGPLTLLFKFGHYDRMTKVMDQFQSSVLVAQVREASLARFITVLARERRHDVAESIVKRFLEGGSKLSQMLYGAVIQMYGRNGNIDEARKWYQAGLERLSFRSSVFHIQMIDAEKTVGTWERAEAAFELMVAECGTGKHGGLGPNAFTTFVEAMTRFGELDRLDEVYEMASARNALDGKFNTRFDRALRKRDSRRRRRV